jgi:ribosomal protein S4
MILLDFLNGVIPQMSRQSIKADIQDGNVFVNGHKVISSAYPLHDNDEVKVFDHCYNYTSKNPTTNLPPAQTKSPTCVNDTNMDGDCQLCVDLPGGCEEYQVRRHHLENEKLRASQPQVEFHVTDFETSPNLKINTTPATHLEATKGPSPAKSWFDPAKYQSLFRFPAIVLKLDQEKAARILQYVYDDFGMVPVKQFVAQLKDNRQIPPRTPEEKELSLNNMFKQGQVLVNGRPETDPNAMVMPGDIVSCPKSEDRVPYPLRADRSTPQYKLQRPLPIHQDPTKPPNPNPPFTELYIWREPFRSKGGPPDYHIVNHPPQSLDPTNLSHKTIVPGTIHWQFSAYIYSILAPIFGLPTDMAGGDLAKMEIAHPSVMEQFFDSLTDIKDVLERISLTVSPFTGIQYSLQ